MASNPAVMRFMNRDAGVLVLIKLIQMSTAGTAEGLSYSEIGAPVRRVADPCAAIAGGRRATW